MLAATPGAGMVAATPGGPMGEPEGGAPGLAPGGDGASAFDYSGVLVMLPGGGIGVGRGRLPSGALEAVPLDGGAPVEVDCIELVKPARQDLVKVVGGPNKGLTGRLISIEGNDAVLADGTLAELFLIGKQAP
jgi:transcription elongation factor SPT5